MATLTVTAADVRVKTGASVTKLTAGESITPGQVVYKKASDSKAYLADANVDAATAAAVGIAFSYADADELVHYVTAGDMDIGATTVKGQTYHVSATAGGIEDTVASSSFNTIVAYGKDTAGTITVALTVSGQQVA